MAVVTSIYLTTPSRIVKYSFLLVGKAAFTASFENIKESKGVITTVGKSLIPIYESITLGISSLL